MPGSSRDGVEHVDRSQEAFDDVGAGKCLVETELRSSSHHDDLVVDVGAQRSIEGEQAGHASTSASMWTPKLVWSGVCLKQIVETTFAFASRLRPMTNRGCPPAESSWMC